ncbi:retropepsin-like aspartic protease family protein [Thalassorhabdomicrobium marinisediminis]|uniref:TIGR02281 family clan AA aspartic protease n=1 Tax=Thalassorhabdomicrobium marinisediminis TaxID=2170577 RepID=A0A2T7G143_9RHOB|nr:TIGR02281 family clan AA aspartic protease [Thalassorhabdomicrobium marinisediminis]PVA08131.1 TIGR02281 family clan AA aspartic protease [Thalassorhabdomicrobium marinisediminis]
MEPSQFIILALVGIVFLPLLVSLFVNVTQLRNLLLWGVIFVGAYTIADNWDTVRAGFLPQQAVITDSRIEVPKGFDNHFRLTLQVNDVPVEFLVDTGASQVVLSTRDAERIGLDPRNLAYIGTAFTANGEVATAPVRLDSVTLGDIRDTRVRASVNSGNMDTSLLGMSYLNRFESIEIRRDLLILNR